MECGRAPLKLGTAHARGWFHKCAGFVLGRDAQHQAYLFAPAARSVEELALTPTGTFNVRSKIGCKTSHFLVAVVWKSVERLVLPITWDVKKRYLLCLPAAD